MKLLSYLAWLCTVEGIVLGALALALDRRSTPNRIAAAASFAYALWAFGMTFAYGSESPDTAVTFYRVSFLGSLFMPPLLTWLYLTFALVSAGARRVCVGLAFAWAGFVLFDYVTSGFYYASFRDGPWSNVGVPSEHWFLATFNPYIQAVQVIASLLVWWHRARQRRSERERRQLHLLIPGLLVTVVVDFLSWGLEVWADLPNAMVLTGSIMVTVTFVVIARYRHLRPDHPLLERHLFDVTQEAAFLLDVHGRIVGVNEPLLRLLSTEESELASREVRSLLADPVFDREWRLTAARRWPHRRILVTLGGRTMVLTLAARFDEFDDLVGLVAFVGDLAGFDERAAAWGVTAREKQVLLLSVQDSTLSEIADALGISPGTVKTHLHHLCEKTGCANRVELFGRLVGRGGPRSSDDIATP